MHEMTRPLIGARWRWTSSTERKVTIRQRGSGETVGSCAGSMRSTRPHAGAKTSSASPAPRDRGSRKKSSRRIASSATTAPAIGRPKANRTTAAKAGGRTNGHASRANRNGECAPRGDRPRSGSGRQLAVLEPAADHLLHAVFEAELSDLEVFELGFFIERGGVGSNQLIDPLLVTLVLLVQAAELGVGLDQILFHLVMRLHAGALLSSWVDRIGPRCSPRPLQKVATGSPRKAPARLPAARERCKVEANTRDARRQRTGDGDRDVAVLPRGVRRGPRPAAGPGRPARSEVAARSPA